MVLPGVSGVPPLAPCPSWSTPGAELDEGGKRPGGPRTVEEGRAWEKGPPYGKREVTFEVSQIKKKWTVEAG
jgi:hypothetical protein